MARSPEGAGSARLILPLHSVPAEAQAPAWGLGVFSAPGVGTAQGTKASTGRRPRGQPSAAPAAAPSPFEHNMALWQLFTFSVTARPPALWLPRTLDVNDHSSQPRTVPGSGSLPEPDKAAFSEPMILANCAGTVPSLSPARNMAHSPSTRLPRP